MSEDIFYVSPAHKARFLGMMQRIGKVYNEKLDPEYAAALYILTARSGRWAKAQDYVSSDRIEIQSLLEDVDFGSGDTILVKLAGNLFNGEQHIDPLEFLRLDEENFQVAMTAIKLRRG
jgi:hypothetical protein